MSVISPKDRDRFRKVVKVMKSATLEGEREAARVAAERLAEQWGLTLDDAIVETHPEIYGDRVSGDEQAAQRQTAYQAWESGAFRMMRRREAQEKYNFQMAKQAAKERGLKEEEARAERERQMKARSFYNTYVPSEGDRFRLISALLRDGLSLTRIAELAEVPTTEVARVYMLTR